MGSLANYKALSGFGQAGIDYSERKGKEREMTLAEKLAENRAKRLADYNEQKTIDAEKRSKIDKIDAEGRKEKIDERVRIDEARIADEASVRDHKEALELLAGKPTPGSAAISKYYREGEDISITNITDPKEFQAKAIIEHKQSGSSFGLWSNNSGVVGVPTGNSPDSLMETHIIEKLKAGTDIPGVKLVDGKVISSSTGKKISKKEMQDRGISYIRGHLDLIKNEEDDAKAKAYNDRFKSMFGYDPLEYLRRDFFKELKKR